VTRTLIIGDVHGCLVELNELLTVASISTTDRVVFVGDLIGRGPNSLGVLDLVRHLNAKAVQGNHEQKLLEAYAAQCSGGDKIKLNAGQQQLLKALRPEHWATLMSLPLYLEFPEHQACVVHAGVLPGLPVAVQDPWVLTHIRSIDKRGQPSHEIGECPWASSYRGPPHLIFGHSAQLGFQMFEYATGLDSACVYGGRLTGMLLDEGQQVPALNQRFEVIVSVAARSIYHQPQS